MKKLKSYTDELRRQHPGTLSSGAIQAASLVETLVFHSDNTVLQTVVCAVEQDWNERSRLPLPPDVAAQCMADAEDYYVDMLNGGSSKAADVNMLRGIAIKIMACYDYPVFQPIA